MIVQVTMMFSLKISFTKGTYWERALSAISSTVQNNHQYFIREHYTENYLTPIASRFQLCNIDK